MKAIILRQIGGPENLKAEIIPDPQPGPNEVIVALKAAALNRRDIWIRQGKYANIKLPIVLGSDGAGEVVELGTGVPQELKGQQVVIYPALNWGDDPNVFGADFKILGLPDNGTYAERVKVPVRNVFAKPASLSFEQAAALPLAGLTAYRALITRGQLVGSETVLITGIGGGVACCALQLAISLQAKVLVTSSSDSKLERAMNLGAAGGANYNDPNWTQEIMRLCDGVGPDIVLDGAGGSSFEKALEITRPGGKVISYGATTGAANQVEVRRIFWKQLNVLGSTMGTAEEFQAMLSLVDRHGLIPVIDQILPLDQAADAHRRVERTEQFGKIVLQI